MVRRQFDSLLVLMLVLACVGCGSGGPEIAGVEGTVTLDGNPLPGATVVFTPENGRPAGATTDENGHYELNFSAGRRGTMPGLNRVMIRTASDRWQDEDGIMQGGAPEMIPMVYNTRSTLEFVVKEDEANVADFDLKSDAGPIAAADTEE